ncbi:helix-turn-helix domain-containing protein [Algoriphagus limi]|uniref:Helix-turn-helix domain-containing protein n=1 Tax=Algoriphagus limi TaxID=2975273 RepID=A0ABT2G349_9BACT|nr:helix-turn-helix domain-containing protein [Algoriphagus limi]MCS5488916.1 helix-turn-helix domain-containing protein [Algoriphagus limi]
MKNPFEVLEARLSNIESLLLDLKHQPKEPQQTSLTPEKPLSIKEAAEFLNLAVPTLYSKVSRGELPVIKRGNRLYFLLADLNNYLEVGRRKSNWELEAEVEQYLKSPKKG